MKATLELYGQTLRQYLKPHWRRTLLLALVLFGGIGLQLVNPQIVRGFLDAAQARADVRQLMLGALTFLGIGLIYQICKRAKCGSGREIRWQRRPSGYSVSNRCHCR